MWMICPNFCCKYLLSLIAARSMCCARLLPIWIFVQNLVHDNVYTIIKTCYLHHLCCFNDYLRAYTFFRHMNSTLCIWQSYWKSNVALWHVYETSWKNMTHFWNKCHVCVCVCVYMKLTFAIFIHFFIIIWSDNFISQCIKLK